MMSWSTGRKTRGPQRGWYRVTVWIIGLDGAVHTAGRLVREHHAAERVAVAVERDLLETYGGG